MAHQQEMNEMYKQRSALSSKLSEIRCRLEEIPVERRDVESLRRNALVRASMDASKQGEIDQYDHQLDGLRKEEERLIETKDAIEGQLPILDHQLDRAQSRLDSLKSAMWGEVAAVLAASAPEGVAPFFKKLWAAMNQARPGIYVINVLDRLGIGQLADEERRQIERDLMQEFSIPTD